MRHNAGGNVGTVLRLHQAYLQWGQHQAWAAGNYEAMLKDENEIDWPGWFLHFCFSSGAGKKTLAALNSGRIGTVEQPILVPDHDLNDAPMIASEGCGGPIRTAPAGWLAALDMIDDPYDIGVRQAAITQGGSIAQTASGALAVLIGCLAQEWEWNTAVESMLRRLKADPRGAVTARLVQEAIEAGAILGSHADFHAIEELPFILKTSRPFAL